MKKKRAFAALLAAALCLGMLTGCGGTPTGSGENNTPAPGNTSAQPSPPVVTPSTNLKKPPQPDQILSDIIQWGNLGLPDGVGFTACEVIKRQSNPEDKEDIVYCQLTAESSYYRIQRQYRCLYNFYDEGGWILDELTPDKEDQWTEAYLDAAGNDILEDMVWLDAFDAEQIQNMDYIGEVDGVHYVGVPYRYGSGYRYDVFRSTSGNRIACWESSEELECNEVFVTGDGQLRFIDVRYIRDSSTGIYKGLCELRDISGNVLTGLYEMMTAYYTFSDSSARCYVKSGGLYGALDENGTVVIPLEYGIGKVPGVQFTPTPDYEEVPTPEGFWSVEMSMGRGANGLFYQRKVIAGWTMGEELFNGKGEPVFDLEYELGKYDSESGLVIIFPECLGKERFEQDAPMFSDGTGGTQTAHTFDAHNSPFRLYDLNGNCRSPEFTWVCGGGLIGQHNRLIVSYQGRPGYLPQILTDEETTYFLYLWGMEHAN